MTDSKRAMSLRPRCLAFAAVLSASWPAVDAGSAPAAGQATRIVAVSQEDEPGFLSANTKAMAKMMTAMSIRPSGDVDRDFVDMMVPHHQGAIDMAVAVLRYGRNPQVRRLAQEIIVDQQQEIAAMRLAVGEPLPPSKPAPTMPARPESAMPGMRMGTTPCAPSSSGC